MRFTTQIRRAAEAARLPSGQLAEVMLDLRRLELLEKAIKPRKLPLKDKYPQPKLAKPAKTAPQTRFCRLCKVELPHRGRADGQRHMLAVKRRWMQQVSHARWRARGWSGLWKPSVQARLERAIARRTAIFREIAPKSATKMTQEDILRVINQGRLGKTRWLNNLEKWKTWVRRRYA